MAILTIRYDGRNKTARSIVDMLRSLDLFQVVEMGKGSDPTSMTKDEFYARIEKAEQQAERGEGVAMQHGEDLAQFLKRNGYTI